MDSSELTLADIRKMHPRERRGLFEDLVAGQGPMLFRRAFSILHDEHLAEDVCQEAWMVLFRYVFPSLPLSVLDPSAPTGPIGSWISGVVTRMALKERRRLGRQRRLTSGAAAALSEVVDSVPPGLTGFTEEVRTALAALTAKQREVFLLRLDELLSFDAIADRLGLSPGAARRQYFAARNRLRELLGGWPG